MRSRKGLTAGAVLSTVALVSTGCLSEGGGGGGGGGDDGTIEVMYAFAGGQEEGFQQEVRAWAEEAGVDVEFAQSGNFNQLINTRVQGNDAPDVAIFPQPGIMGEFAQEGLLQPLGDVVDDTALDAMVPGALETGQVDGEQYAVPMSINVKSIVFYPKPEFEERYEAPETFEDLVSLSEQIATDGAAPWCFGIESEAATGWPATDWVENIILVQQGEEFYNQWVNHEVPFDAPEVVDALNTMEQLLLDEGQVAGGRQSIASTNFNTAANPMFDDPPGCYMYRQGNFVAQEGGFPDAILDNIDAEIGVFPIPGDTPESRPVLGGGDLVGLFNGENEDAQALVQFLASPEFGTNGYGESGNWISPRTDFDTSLYPSDLWRQIAEIAYESTEFAFDGSDQMPGEVGSGSFWREMTAWISGGQDAQTALENIEASWPA